MKNRLSPLMLLAPTLLLGSMAANAAASSGCTMRLIVELTPDVPNPRDAGFLSSLLDDRPGYQLKWVKQIDMSFIALDLTGRGPEDRCDDVAAGMGRDARVLSIHREPDDVDTVSVAANREPSEGGPRIRLSRDGLGALYWAARHPTQAWRIVMPLKKAD